MSDRSSTEYLFSWVHLSDIHAGHGSTAHGWDQQSVLRAIRQDIERCVRDPGRRFPQPDAVLITGDIAFSGGSQKRYPAAAQGEYQAAADWLDKIGSALGLGRDRIWMVPGNHDVDRGVDERERDIERLVDVIRNRGADALDAELAHAKERNYLARRQEAYLAFAAQFAPVSAPEEARDEHGHALFWTATVNTTELVHHGITLRLAGLNTVLVGGRVDDEGALQVGKQQLNQCLPQADMNHVVLALSHHPVSWLADERHVGSVLRAHAHVHLCGHVHEPRSEDLRSGGGERLVTLVAGAVHADQGEGPVGHGYSFGALCAIDGALVVRVWPRTWVDDSQRFVADTTRTRDDHVYVDHRLDIHLARSRMPPRPAPSPPSRPPRTHPVQLTQTAPTDASATAPTLPTHPHGHSEHTAALSEPSPASSKLADGANAEAAMKGTAPPSDAFEGRGRAYPPRAPTGLKPMASCGFTLPLLRTLDDLEVLDGSGSAQIEEILARATVAGAIPLSLREMRERVLYGDALS